LITLEIKQPKIVVFFVEFGEIIGDRLLKNKSFENKRIAPYKIEKMIVEEAHQGKKYAPKC